MAVPICFGLLLLMGIGPALPWGRTKGANLKRALLYPVSAALVALVLTALLGGRGFNVLFTGALAGYALWVTFDQALRPARSRIQRGESVPGAVANTVRRAPRMIGAYTVHLGVIMTFVAIAVSSTYQSSQEALLSPGQSMAIGDYELTFQELVVDEKDHLTAQRAIVSASRNGKDLGTLEPALNFYQTRREPIGTPSVRTSASHDIYLTLQSVGGGTGKVGLRVILTPAVVWIWIGVCIMVAGTILCLVSPQPARRRAPAKPAEATS